jgi:hypothetical protein
MDTVIDRPLFTKLSPDDEQEFLRKQAAFEAAYRRTGEPTVLFDALAHAWWSRQTVPGWLVLPIGNALIEQRTDEMAERYRERMRHVRRYTCVRNLRRQGHTQDDALDFAVSFLEDEPARAARPTIEDSYNLVRRDLRRAGRESEFFYFVASYDDDRSPNDYG